MREGQPSLLESKKSSLCSSISLCEHKIAKKANMRDEKRILFNIDDLRRRLTDHDLGIRPGIQPPDATIKLKTAVITIKEMRWKARGVSKLKNAISITADMLTNTNSDSDLLLTSKWVI